MIKTSNSKAINNVINSVPDTQQVDEKEFESGSGVGVPVLDYEKVNSTISNVVDNSVTATREIQDPDDPNKTKTITQTQNKEKSEAALKELFPGAAITVTKEDKKGLMTGDTLTAEIKIGGKTYSVKNLGGKNAYGKLQDIMTKEESFREKFLTESEETKASKKPTGGGTTTGGGGAGRFNVPKPGK